MIRKADDRFGNAVVRESRPRPHGRADIVQDWNDTLCTVAETVVTKHNPGVPTRAMAMMNGSIYDIFQAVNRTHKPFKVNTLAPGASVDAAVSQAAYRVLSDMYPEMQATLDSTLATRLGAVADGAAKTAGIDLGNFVAQQYITSHQNDGWDLPDAYTPIVGPGPLEHGSHGRPQHPKRLGIRLGLGRSLGHAESRPLRLGDAVHHRRHEHASGTRMRSTR